MTTVSNPGGILDEHNITFVSGSPWLQYKSFLKLKLVSYEVEQFPL